MKGLFAILLTICAFNNYSIAQLSIPEYCINSTTRLYCQKIRTDSDGHRRIHFSIGTGFFFNFQINGKTYNYIVTNKHVVKDYDTLKLLWKRLTISDKPYPMYGSNDSVILNDLQERLIMHPDSQVDIAIIYIGDFLNEAQRLGRPYALAAFSEDNIPPDSVYKQMEPMQDVYMIGYPQGIYDTFNNLPVARKGITATLPSLNYNGKSDFIVDIPNFHGSSGSPIILDEPIYLINGVNFYKKAFYLIGINYESYFVDVNGKVSYEDPTWFDSNNSKPQFPINIAIVVRANKLLDFTQMIVRKWKL